MADLEKGQEVQTPVASAVGTAYATSVGSLDPPPAILQATTVATPLPSLAPLARCMCFSRGARKGCQRVLQLTITTLARRPAHEERPPKRGRSERVVIVR